MLRRFALLGALSMVVIACSAETEAPPSENVEAVAAELTAADAVTRAQQWVSVKLHYCQAPNGARDYDAACTTYCKRQSNPKWDPYRSDCSGLISWAWNLPAPGRVTTQFAPFQKDITHTINAIDLKAGDAINNTDHIMLFKAWVTPGTKAIFLEEPGCSSAQPYARETTSNVTISGSSIHVAFNGMSFTAIRYGALTPTPPAPPAAPPSSEPAAPQAPAAPPPAEPTPIAPPPDPSGTRALSDTSGCAVSSSAHDSSMLAPIAGLAVALAFARRRRRG
jgi:MYXO-CTERM domain-containing protein